MTWLMTGSAVVIVAHQFNPSVITQHWLIKNNLLAETEFSRGCIFTDAIVQVQSSMFQLLVTPEQLHFVPGLIEEIHQEMVIDKLGSIIEKLPHTPFNAIGLNFIWLMFMQNGNINQISREMFAKKDKHPFLNFGSDNALFGSYMSQDFGPFRLKLDIKPMDVQDGDEMRQCIQCAFNFHRSIDKENGATQIRELLTHWNETRDEAKRILFSMKVGDDND